MDNLRAVQGSDQQVSNHRAKCGARLSYVYGPARASRRRRGYDRRHKALVTQLTGEGTDRAVQGFVMASHPMEPRPAVPPSEWRSSHDYSHGQLMACLRAGIIALVLLGILALIVLF